jgi:hypothetical protein
MLACPLLQKEYFMINMYKTIDVEQDGSCVTNLYNLNPNTHTWIYLMDSFEDDWKTVIDKLIKIGQETFAEGNIPEITYYIDSDEHDDEIIKAELADDDFMELGKDDPDLAKFF